MAKNKVFEISMYDNTRRFISQLSPDNHTASHVLRENSKWFVWNGSTFVECDECEIVNSIDELNKQEL